MWMKVWGWDVHAASHARDVVHAGFDLSKERGGGREVRVKE